MKQHEKYIQYAGQITELISQLFDEDSENYIDIEDLDATQFIHALANVAPCHLYNKLTNNNLNTLEFNHVANTLCFQFSEKVAKD